MFTIGIGILELRNRKRDDGQEYQEGTLSNLYPSVYTVPKVRAEKGVTLVGGPVLYVGRLARGEWNGKPWEHLKLASCRPLSLADAEKAWSSFWSQAVKLGFGPS